MIQFKKFCTLILVCLLTGCTFSVDTKVTKTPSDSEIRDSIHVTLDNWHRAAAEADFDSYFALMTKDGVFLGTDASENWQNKEFREFSKPYFDKGKAWSFTPLERNIYVDDQKATVWFDELLDTQMGICRGSGILKIENDQWKIKHYVLSIAIPNENVSEMVELKKEWDSTFINLLKFGSKSAN